MNLKAAKYVGNITVIFEKFISSIAFLPPQFLNLVKICCCIAIDLCLFKKCNHMPTFQTAELMIKTGNYSYHSPTLALNVPSRVCQICPANMKCTKIEPSQFVLNCLHKL